MIYIAWVLSLIAVAGLAYHYRRLNDLARQAGDTVYNVVLKKKEEDESDNSVEFLDPDDLAFQVKAEALRKREELNQTREP